MHELGPEPNFNESMYFNFIDPEQSVAGFFRLGNRANEGTAEMTACLYLPEGPVAFMFRRPEITSNDCFDAGGMRFDVLEPFTSLRVSYSGPVLILDDPWKLSDPGTAFRHSPTADAQVELAFSGCSPPVGGEPDQPGERPGEEFARGHYEQLVEATGTVTVGPDKWVTNGFGLRDHSWGPRYWQAPWYYRWLTGNFGPDFGFMGSHIARRHGDGQRGGFVWRDGTLHLCDDVRLRTTEEGRDRTHRTLELMLRSGPHSWMITGRVTALVPLRNRRTAPDGSPLVTRISEGLTRWETDEGHVGYGLAEYLDQIVDGTPVGAGLD